MEIPDSVMGIGANAFYGCSGLGSVTFYGCAPAGLSESGILINTSSVRYPRRYASSFESEVPASKFGGYLPMEVDELLNAFEWNFSQDLERPWSSDYGVSYDGEGSMRSGRIANDESTWIETTVNGPGRLSFWWKASSEEYDGEVFDYAYLSVDGVPQGTLDNYRLNGVAIGGKTDWVNVNFDIVDGGQHTIRWTYCKDEMDESDVGEDCAWLDEVSFVPYVSLTFDLAEGVGIVPEAKLVAMGSTLSLPKSEGFSRSKYRFVGWSDGTKVYEAGAEYVVSDSNVEFSVVWEAKTLSAPTISSTDVENGGTHEAAYALISMTAEAGASIYYTVDGAEPTTNGMLYVAPIMAFGMTERIQAIAVRDDYFDSAISEFAFSRKPYSAAECLDVAGVTVSTGGGDTAWSRVLGSAAHDGVAAMRSGEIGDGESSSIEMTVVGAGEIGFWWKSSSEISRNRKFDYVSFLIDGVEQSWMGGEMDWTNETFAVTGSGAHMFKWVYQKNDNGLTKGEDCAWLDGVTWTPTDPIPAVAANAAPEAVTNAIESAGFADAEALKAAIAGIAAKYAAFKEWAGRVKGKSGVAVAGEAAVVANTNAAAAFMLGAERLFEKAPRIEFGEMEVRRQDAGSPSQGGDGGAGSQGVTVSVVVKDGEEAVRCAAEKVKEMFEATRELGDWEGEARLTPTVDVLDGDGETMRFRVTPGDGKSSSAFLRIRK